MFKHKNYKKSDRTLDEVETLKTQVEELRKVVTAQAKQLTELNEKNNRLRKDLYQIEDDVKKSCVSKLRNAQNAVG